MPTLLLILVALSAFSVAAADRKPLALAVITSEQAEIRAGLQGGSGLYKDMPTRTKEELLSRQSTVLTVIDGKTSSDELSEEERLLVFNNLEWIEAAINNADSDRLVCTREKTLGSTRMQRVCVARTGGTQ